MPTEQPSLYSPILKPRFSREVEETSGMYAIACHFLSQTLQRRPATSTTSWGSSFQRHERVGTLCIQAISSLKALLAWPHFPPCNHRFLPLVSSALQSHENTHTDVFLILRQLLRASIALLCLFPLGPLQCFPLRFLNGSCAAGLSNLI